MGKGKHKSPLGRPKEAVIPLVVSSNMVALPAHKAHFQAEDIEGDPASEQSTGIENCTTTPAAPSTPQDGDFSGDESTFSSGSSLDHGQNPY